MYGTLVFVGLIFSSLLIYIITHVYAYFRDPKGLRKFHAIHPLAGFSHIPFALIARKEARSQSIMEAHKRTGHRVLRTGPNGLTFNSLQAIKDIYGHGAPCGKDPQYQLLAGSHYHLADVVDKADHARKRKIMSSAYALKNLEDWEYKVADKTARMLRQFDARSTDIDPNNEIDYRSWTNFFSLDAIADIGLSAKLGFLDQGGDRCTAVSPSGKTWQANYRDALYANSRATSHLIWYYRWYPTLVWLSKTFSPYYRQLWRLNDDWDGIYLHLADQRLARYNANEKLDDFFQALMTDKNGIPHNLEWGEIVAEVSIMMNAGSTTTAIAITNVMYYLLKHPQYMSRLRAEVDSVLDEPEVVAPYAKVRHLPFLRACIDEALRITPPTPQGLTRETPPEGARIDGEYIAGNVTVQMPAYVAHRNEEMFPDPETYNPDRWLGEKGKELGPYFIAFSAGARGCIGRNISYLEQTVVLASMVHRYDVELVDPEYVPKRWETQNYHLGDLPIRVRRRAGRAEKVVVTD
ncbi:Isotrichodermin C-15 hydroxylase [Elsinoe australis]|uniref:Isotrichodermin C-15 hydroxylase n=1 Tax=Elsinoe australis TaxID=40998 RepID=A0A2P7Z1J6_9PEZI|nr:Isotrichodermin C-15 hydroxylase [Elsinoe australis]